MKNKQPETCCALLLRTQGQLELLTGLMTQEHLLCFQVYKEEQMQLIKQRSQALEKFACWLYRMGLQDEMLQLMQQEPGERSERLCQAQHTKQPICGCVWCTRKRQTTKGQANASSPQEEAIPSPAQQEGGES